MFFFSQGSEFQASSLALSRVLMLITREGSGCRLPPLLPPPSLLPSLAPLPEKETVLPLSQLSVWGVQVSVRTVCEFGKLCACGRGSVCPSLCFLREERPTAALMTCGEVSEPGLMSVTACRCVDVRISVSLCGVGTCVLSLLEVPSGE